MNLCIVDSIVPQQRKLVGSSAKKSSGEHWCRRRVGFNEVPENVPKVPEKVREAWCRARFNRVAEKVPGKVWEALVQSQVSFDRVAEFRGRSGRLWCRARSGSTGFRRSSGEGSRKPWCKAKSGSTGFRIREALVQSQVKFNRVPVKVPRARSGSRGFRRRLQRRSPRRFWESLVQGQVQQGSGEGSGEGLGGFGAEPGQVQQIPEKVPEKVPGSHGAKPGQVQQGSGEGSGEGLGGFGAEPGQAQQGSGEGSGEGLGGFGAELGQVQQGSENCGWCTARSGSRGFWRIPEKAWEALVQSQVRFKRVPKVWEALVQGQARFNSVPEKFYEKFLGGFGAEPGQVQQDSGECSGECLGGFGAARSSLTGPEKVPGEGLGLWCRARSGSRGFRRRLQRRSRRRFRESLVQGQVRFNGFWRSLFLFFMFFWLRSTLQRDLWFAKIKRCGCWGCHRSLFFPNCFWPGPGHVNTDVSFAALW